MEEKNFYYTNSIEIETTGFDVKFKIKYNSLEEGKTQSKKLCEIAMSPQHAKAFSNILQKVMNEYEEKIEKINIGNEKNDDGE